MADAIAAMREARKKAGDIVLTPEQLEDLKVYLADRMTNGGWTAEDRKDYLDACKAEFDNPTAAGGLEEAVRFWAARAAEIRGRTCRP